MNIDDSGRSAAAGGQQQAPDIDLLADYHAGVLDEQTTRQVADYIAGSPQAQEVIRALDATVADLSALPPVEVPEFVSRRIDTALAQESGRADLRQGLGTSGSIPAGHAPGGVRPLATMAQPGQTGGPSDNVISMDQARERRNRRTRLLTAVAAGVVVLGGGAFALSQAGDDAGSAGTNIAGAPYESSTIDDAAQNVQAFGSIKDEKVSAKVAGQMAELSERRRCLNLIPKRPVKAPTAVQQITYEGTDAYAFVFPTSDSGEVRVMVVTTANCAEVLEDKTVPSK